MNSFTFSGNLGKDAQLKSTQAGSNVLQFSVAVKSGYGDKEKTNWIACVIFGKRAEGNLVSYLTKGQQVVVTGEFELKEWQGQDGTQNKMASCIVRDLTLVGGKPENQGAQATQPAQGFQQPQHGFNNPPPAPQQPSGGEAFGDDIPFRQRLDMA